MEKMKMQTKNLADENFNKLLKLFPNAFTEHIDENGKLKRAIDKNILEQEINTQIISEKEERYQFTWPEKNKAVLLANSPINATLRPYKEESIGKNGEAGKWDSENLYIEGDNLDVLKLLQETYLGKVKMIYIDPPYNTGGDFIYKDDFVSSKCEYLGISGQYDKYGNRLVQNKETQGRFHTDWLNMIYPRLKLAKNLLSDDGVIFISIDDHEQASLKFICDEIFNRNNFVGQITLVNNPQGRDYGGIAKMHEYIIVYTKNAGTEINNLREPNKKFPLIDDRGGFELRELRNRNITFNSGNRPNLYYPFYIDPNTQLDNGLFAISLEKKQGLIELYPKESQGVQTVWRWGKHKVKKFLNTEVVAKKMNNDGYMIVEKYRKKTKRARSVWNGKEDNSAKGTILLKEIFEGKKFFDFPKSEEMIRKIIEMGSTKNSIILDFFSGSATTAHAVMKLNAEDGGKRRFIMVQLPEPCDEKSESFKAGYKNICEIGKERIRRAGAKIKEENPLITEDLGFRVLKLDSSNMKDVYYSPDEMSQGSLSSFIDNIKEDRTSEDLLFQVMLELGILLSSEIKELNTKGYKVYKVENLIACFDEKLSNDVVIEIAKMQPEYFIMQDSSIENDSMATNFQQIFLTYSPQTKRMVL